MKRLISGARGCVLLAAAAVLSAPATAQSVDSVISAENTRLQRQVQSQVRVDRIVSQTRSITDEFRSVNKEIDGLKIYNEVLGSQVARQEQKLAEIEASMSRATVINRQVLPLIQRMTAALKESVALDIPFLMSERTERVENLEVLLDDPDVSAAEKFRKAMEAYQIEIDYGRTIESYTDLVNIDGSEFEVDFLRIGRIALLFQNADGSMTGWYNPTTKQFEINNDYRVEVEKGLAVATKQIAPELIKIPVSGPEA